MKKIIWHPFLLAIFPALLLFSYNVNPVRFNRFVLVEALILVGAVILFFIARLILKDSRKAAIAVSLFVIWFFYFGYFKDALGEIRVANFLFTRYRYLMLVWSALWASVFWALMKKEKILPDLTLTLNFIALIIMIASLAGITGRFLSSTKTEGPDIYFIIPDSYSNLGVLEKYFNYDNKEFVNYLHQKNFQIINESRVNYPISAPSAISLLDMKYINYLTDIFGADFNDYRPLLEMVENPIVPQIFKNAGYKYVLISTGDSIYGIHKKADFESIGANFDDFFRLIVMATVLRPLTEQVYHSREIVLTAWSKLREAPEMELGGPKFVYAHIMSPHAPYLFGPDGEVLGIKEKGLKPQEKMDYYLGQLKYVNKELEKTIDQILEKSKKPPVIVIQSDHGFLLPSEFYGKNTALKEQLRNFSAYYLPEKIIIQESSVLTPVNTFRFILNHYLGMKFETLENKSYTTFTAKPYTFIEIPF